MKLYNKRNLWHFRKYKVHFKKLVHKKEKKNERKRGVTALSFEKL